MKNFNWADLLRNHYLFSSLNENEIEQLLKDEVSEEIRYSEGSLIVREGEPGASIFLIGLGSVHVVRQRGSGHEVTLSVLKRGEFFGEMAIFEGKPRAATVKATENSLLLEIKGQPFLQTMSQHPGLAFKVMSERLRHTNEQFISERVMDIDEKINLLNNKIEAEIKAVSASLEASNAVFEQTRTRTNEVISSAERNQSWMKWITTFFTFFVSLLAFFGLKETFNFKEKADRVKEAYIEAKKLNEEIKNVEPKIKGLEDASPKIANLLAIRGNELYDEGNYRGALSYFSTATSLAPDNTIHNLNIAAVYRDLCAYNTAKQNLNKYIEKNPDDDKAIYDRGVVNHYLKEYDQAVNDYNRVIEISNDMGTVEKSLFNLSVIYSLKFKQDKREEYLLRAIANLEESLRLGKEARFKVIEDALIPIEKRIEKQNCPEYYLTDDLTGLQDAPAFVEWREKTQKTYLR